MQILTQLNIGKPDQSDQISGVMEITINKSNWLRIGGDGQVAYQSCTLCI